MALTCTQWQKGAKEQAECKVDPQPLPSLRAPLDALKGPPYNQKVPVRVYWDADNIAYTKNVYSSLQKMLAATKVCMYLYL